MSEPLTRQDVERAVHQLAMPFALGSEAFTGRQVIAALLAMAECEGCEGTGHLTVTGNTMNPPDWTARCPRCKGTGLNQTALARGLAALRETR